VSRGVCLALVEVEAGEFKVGSTSACCDVDADFDADADMLFTTFPLAFLIASTLSLYLSNLLSPRAVTSP